jgi:hypothetical protein
MFKGTWLSTEMVSTAFKKKRSQKSSNLGKLMDVLKQIPNWGTSQNFSHHFL